MNNLCCFIMKKRGDVRNSLLESALNRSCRFDLVQNNLSILHEIVTHEFVSTNAHKQISNVQEET